MTYGIREGEPDTLKKHASPLTDSFRLLMSGWGSNRAMLTRKRVLKHPTPPTAMVINHFVLTILHEVNE